MTTEIHSFLCMYDNFNKLLAGDRNKLVRVQSFNDRFGRQSARAMGSSVPSAEMQLSFMLKRRKTLEIVAHQHVASLSIRNGINSLNGDTVP